MSLIEWNDAFRIGIESVDHEHRELIALINELHLSLAGDAAKERVDDFFGELHAAISAHFALEEKTMMELGYPAFEAHKADHERLLDEIREIMDGHWRGAYRDYQAELSAHLKAWFGVHFQVMDAPLHAFVGGAGG